MLTDRERVQLQATLGCDADELDAVLDRYADASREEYVRMILGQRVFTRGQDMLEYRLLLLIEHVFDHRLPSEQVISSVFQTTASQSRTLLRSVLAKYRYELHQATADTVSALLASAEPDPEDADARDDNKRDRLVTVGNANMVEEINRRIVAIDARLSPLVKKPGTGAVYKLRASSYQRLRDSLS